MELAAVVWPPEWTAALTTPACSVVGLKVGAQSRLRADFWPAIAGNKSLRELQLDAKADLLPVRNFC